MTRHVPKLKELIRAGLEHPGFAFIEVLSDCTEIFGRKNEMGSSPEMMMRQKSELRLVGVSFTLVAVLICGQPSCRRAVGISPERVASR